MINKKPLLAFALSGLLPTSATKAWEVDSWSTRAEVQSFGENPVDLYLINDRVNTQIRFAVDIYNLEEKGCSPEERDHIAHYVADALSSQIGADTIEEWVQDGDVNSYKKPNKGQVIYGIKQRFYTLQGLLNLNGYTIGPDKIGHFFDQGHDVFLEYRKSKSKSDAIIKSFKVANELEHGVWGLSGVSSGVKSFGDISANFSGLQFYRKLTEGRSPYLKCENGKYSVVKDFDFTSYVNSSWDEAINCSIFTETKVPFKGQWVDKRIEDRTNVQKGYLGFLAKHELTCPIKQSDCDKLVKINCARYFVSPVCISKAAKVNDCNLNDVIEFKDFRYSDYKFDRGQNADLKKDGGNSAIQ